jgi:hypothetical protein
MADLFPKPFLNANLSRATVPPAIQEARRAYRNHFLPDSFLQLFWRRWQWSYGHPLASEFRSFRQFAGSGTRHLQPHQAVEPTVPELGMLILGAAVYITQTSKGDDRSPCHPSSTRADNGQSRRLRHMGSARTPTISPWMGSAPISAELWSKRRSLNKWQSGPSASRRRADEATSDGNTGQVEIVLERRLHAESRL